MLESQRKFKISKALKSKIFFLVLILLFAVLVKAVVGVYFMQKESGKELELAEARYEDVKARQGFLESEIARLSTDKGVDEEIRQQFGATNNGEKLIVIVDQSPDDDSSLVPTEKTGFWSKVKGFFKD